MNDTGNPKPVGTSSVHDEDGWVYELNGKSWFVPDAIAQHIHVATHEACFPQGQCPAFLKKYPSGYVDD